ncbi:PASTA domain-containing protein [Agathobaculum sp. NSJ-28]|uniref:PASTA domain-containing protein n=2 Tax=Agathobaculum TaxID=2048137 RepID=A0A923LWF8_9FIRM|nr:MULTISPECIES: penicillin-binding transpeptidase domain-containing protein [Butyricicoccaceae]MBS6882588.1 PASTA domain-containing protein [Clostridiaceae bacterium]SCJ29985.1 Peptidoglycan synthase FtsI precursor [uncultured Butyricicoccus sp.]MBC5725167.1 PASTA domain-containing protein [Agathobaculum faecis]MCU6789619.1 penicillin-binding transpeptidase domain-containing protein [Agathobaculum ammoniilyticum]WOC74461.1 penicillin-binding transpeptidase domain-containing protein [Intestini
MAAKGPNNLMRSRIVMLTLAFVAIGFGLVAVRLLYMQVFRNDFYVQQATTLQTRDTLVTPNRGTIYDANMQVLAESASVARITVNPKAVIDESKVNKGIPAEQQQQELAQILADTLELDYDTVLGKIKRTDTQYQIIAQKVDKDTENALYEKLEAAGCGNAVYSEPDTKRYYKYGAFLSTVLGYVNDDNVGVYGLESEYESELAGTAGRIVRAQNAKNQDMPYDYQQYIPATDGNSLVLTIDSDIQNILEKHLETALADNPNARDGVSGIVMDVKTGAVLAMANLPDFDPNQPRVISDERYLNELKETVQKLLEEAGVSAEIPDKYYQEGGLDNLPESVQNNEALVDALTDARTEELYKMWYNPVVTDTYEPGSTFKLMNVATAYELGVVHAEDTFYCGGSMMVGDWKEPIKCHNTNGHGSQTLTQAVMNSCNVAMMQIVAKTGRERFYDFFKAFGMNSRTGIDLPNESPGIFFDVEDSTSWNEVSLAVSSFGQRFQVTPIQMASMISAIVDDGRLKKPYLVREVLNADGSIKSTAETEVVRQVISEDTSAYMRDTMLQVVESGTGKNAYVPGYRVGGKTATSEILKEAEDVEDRYTASFIGVAPMDDPQIVVLVAISDLPESSPHGGGALAAPVVGRIMEDVLPYIGVTPVYTDEENDRRELTVPGVVGSTQEQAASTLQQAGFAYRVVGSGDTVTDQVPASGVRIPASGKVILYMGEDKPAEQIEVPDLTGLTPDECRDTLEQYGLYLKQKGVASSQITGNTTASRQSPAKGTKVNIGAVVTVEFSDTTGVDDR